MRKQTTKLLFALVLFSTLILSSCGGLIGIVASGARRTLDSKDEGKSTVIAFIKGPGLRSYKVPESFWHRNQETFYEVSIENVKTGDSYKLYRLESSFTKGGIRQFVIASNVKPGEYYFEELIYRGTSNQFYGNHYYDFKNRVTFKVEKGDDVVFIGSYLVDDSKSKEPTIAKLTDKKLTDSFAANIKQRVKTIDFGSDKDNLIIKKSWNYFDVKALNVYFLFALDYSNSKWGQIAKAKVAAMKNENKDAAAMLSLISEMQSYQKKARDINAQREAKKKKESNY